MRIHTPQGGPPVEAIAGGQDAGGGFFQRRLAKNRGSTPAERKLWREGIYDQIRDVVSRQGSLGIERMCQLAQVSRAASTGLCRSRGRGKRDGSAIGDSAGRTGTSAPLRLS